MTRHVFISYQHADQMKARGLNLMTHNKNVDVDFTGRHLLDPVKSRDPDYISRKIKEKIKGAQRPSFLLESRQRTVLGSTGRSNGVASKAKASSESASTPKQPFLKPLPTAVPKFSTGTGLTMYNSSTTRSNVPSPQPSAPATCLPTR